MTEEKVLELFASIRELMNGLPPVKEKRQTIYDIAGFPSWETVASNVWAFYLSHDGPHGFGNAVFQALLNVVERKRPERFHLQEREFFTVVREKDFIDILIQGEEQDEAGKPSWALIIENKIHADLYNDLGKYWSAVKSDNKLGIVLSLQPVSESRLKGLANEGVDFINILHRELCDEVRQMLPAFYDEADDRHLLYLKDFLQNIESHYPNPVMEKQRQAQLKVYQANTEVIDALRELEAGLNEHVGAQSREAFASFSFSPVQPSNKLQARHFTFSQDAAMSQPAVYGTNVQAFRFFLNQHELFRHGRLTIYFELFGDWAKYGSLLRKEMNESALLANSPDMKEASAANAIYSYSQLAKIESLNIKEAIASSGVEEAVSEVLRRNFFQHDKMLMVKCTEILERLMMAN